MIHSKRIRVLVVDDSSIFRLFLTYVLNLDHNIEVVGMAHDGIEALAQVKILKPDLITIDMNMPRMGGFEATEQIMKIHPIPIIVVSAFFNSTESTMMFNALKAGAVTILPKPEGIGHPKHEETVKHFIKMIKLMSEVKVISRHKENYSQKNSKINSLIAAQQETKGIELIAIGASAGGPPVLQKILLGVSNHLNIPVIIVQHVDPSFAVGMADWLKQTTSKNVFIASTGMELKPGCFYMAPADSHVGFKSKGVLKVNHSKPEHSCRPSVSYMFRSAKEVYGSAVLGIILTGMGRDGAAELLALYERGAPTIVQDPSTVLVNGMTGEAVKLGAASQILSPDGIIDYINHLITP